jgi:hypothetical protein
MMMHGLANVKRIIGTLNKDQCAFMIASRSVLLRMKDFSDER